MNKQVSASEIAKYLKGRLIGEDIKISGICSVDMIESGKLTFISRNVLAEDINAKALLIVNDKKEIDPKSTNSYIKVANPRLAFARVVNKFFNPKEKAAISKSAKIGNNVEIGKDVSIGEHCVIEDNVSIGSNTVIHHNVVVLKNTIIGENCLIGSGTTIGEEGLGLGFEEDRTPVRIPQLGKVVIHNNVEIGANCTILRGTINDTVIHDNVKMGHQNNIGHNCRIGKNTIITSQVLISGSVEIGDHAWLGPNCSVIDGIKIGKGVKVGIGAVVTRNVGDNTSLMGLEALQLKDLARLKRNLNIKMTSSDND